jgi:hypothetical protein
MKQIYVITPVDSNTIIGKAHFFTDAERLVLKYEMWDIAAGMFRQNNYRIHLIYEKDLHNFN